MQRLILFQFTLSEFMLRPRQRAGVSGKFPGWTVRVLEGTYVWRLQDIAHMLVCKSESSVSLLGEVQTILMYHVSGQLL